MPLRISRGDGTGKFCDLIEAFIWQSRILRVLLSHLRSNYTDKTPIARSRSDDQDLLSLMSTRAVKRVPSHDPSRCLAPLLKVDFRTSTSTH